MITEIAQIEIKPGSENFTEWRGLVGQYFAVPPEVEHTRKVVSSVLR